jgi:hypothetical protein
MRKEYSWLSSPAPVMSDDLGDGMSGLKEASKMAATHEYKIIKLSSHEKLAKALNEEAADGWRPINVYSLGIDTTDHFALLERPVEAD